MKLACVIAVTTFKVDNHLEGDCQLLVDILD